MTLEDLLSRLISDTVHTLHELAADLSISPGLLEQMLWDLDRGGYIRAIETSCDVACQSCPYHGGCRVTHGERIWTVTEKGLRAAKSA
jgi:hypothetical protein